MSKYTGVYNCWDFGDKEIELRNIFILQMTDARNYFLNMIKPRLDRSYKLYIGYTGDRQREIQKWQCVSKDTEILTMSGWKGIGQIKKGERVLSYDLSSGKVLEDCVNDTFSYDIDDEMVAIKSCKTDQLVTTNHRVLLKKSSKKIVDNTRVRTWDNNFSYHLADSLGGNSADYRLPVGGTFDGDVSIGEDWAEFVGWFLTDGCFTRGIRSGGYITQSKPETLAKLRALLIKMDIPFKEWSRKKEKEHYHDEHRFFFDGKSEVMEKMRKLIPHRKPNNLLWNLKLSEKRRLIDGICYGDGSRWPNGKYHIVSKPNKEFIDWFQTLLHLTGLRGKIADRYINIGYKDTVDVVSNKHVSLVKYKGKVWSISTNRTNYIARRNGHIFITGNSNIFVPYTQSAVETLIPRILDARPDFKARGRNSDTQVKADKQQKLMDYDWEIAKMDGKMEDLVRSSLVYGTGFLQVYWKKDVRTYKFLKTKDLNSKKYKYQEKEQIYYDAPYCEWVDNYALWYDWHNTNRENKQYWFKRLVMTEPEVRRRYPGADKARLSLAFHSPGGDLADYASVRNLVKANHQFIVKGLAPLTSFTGIGDDKYNIYGDQRLRMYEVFEWWRPFDDAFCVMVGASYVPILKGAIIPIPYDFKEAPFIEVPYLKLPYEFEGYGLPMILENPQLMLNMIKNQRLDATALSIHKMWIVNPLANINKEELVTRPFGIIYSIDPNGVREVQFSDVKFSAYKEEDLLKQDMRYSSGVDDFSMGGGQGGANSATEVRHLRESTLERVRLFVNHLGDGLSDVMRYWMDMHRQFFTETMTIRIIGNDGQIQYPLIEKDDLEGKFDYQAEVLPSIAGQMDVKRKQDMDLFQLLINMQFIDPKKLVSKVLTDWDWTMDSLIAEEQMQPGGLEGAPQPGAEGMPGGAPGMPPEGMLPPPGPGEAAPPPDINSIPTKIIPPQILRQVLQLTGGGGAPGGSSYAQAAAPINLMGGGMPPTVPGVPASGGGPGYAGKTQNPRGMNRKIGGKVNTNVRVADNNSEEDRLLTKTHNIQK